MKPKALNVKGLTIQQAKKMLDGSKNAEVLEKTFKSLPAKIQAKTLNHKTKIKTTKYE